MSFAEFKKNQKKSGTIEELQKKLEESEGKKVSYEDDRFWYPQRDRATKRGSAVIRFLPARDDDVIEEGGKKYSPSGLPWVKTYSHSFQNKKNGRWFIEECPTTIGGKCAVCEDNSTHWNSGTEAGKQVARDRKRRLSYISNVLVISDPATPENEGKVFLYKYGQKIHDMIDKKINPEFADQKPVNVFDFWEGANFALRIGQKAGYTNYDDSEFLPVSGLGDDAYLETVYESLYKLSEFIVPSRFKGYDELKERLDFVLGDVTSSTGGGRTVEDEPDVSNDSVYDADPSSDSDDDDDSRESFFDKLASADV